MGRPKKDIKPADVERLAKEGASNRDIAVSLGCDEATVRRRFSANLDKGRTARRLEILRKQNAAFRRGNIAMLIWLGKQELDQAEPGTRPASGVEADGSVEAERKALGIT